MGLWDDLARLTTPLEEQLNFEDRGIDPSLQGPVSGGQVEEEEKKKKETDPVLKPEKKGGSKMMSSKPLAKQEKSGLAGGIGWKNNTGKDEGKMRGGEGGDKMLGQTDTTGISDAANAAQAKVTPTSEEYIRATGVMGSISNANRDDEPPVAPSSDEAGDGVASIELWATEVNIPEP